MTKDYGIFLGVSLISTQFFSKKCINNYARWALQHYRRFLIVIADTGELINWITLKKISYEEASERIQYRVNCLIKGYKKAIITYEDVDILRMSSIVLNDDYETIYKLIKDEYSINKHFRERVNATIANNIGGLLASLELGNQILKKLSPYIFHELAVSIYLKWFNKPSYPSQVSPSKDALMIDVLSGNLTDVISKLKLKSEEYEYIIKDCHEGYK